MSAGPLATQAAPNGDAVLEGALWNAVPGMVLVLEPDGRAQHVSAAFAELLERPASQVLGSVWLHALADASREELRHALARRDDFELRFAVNLRDARIRWVDCTAHWIEPESLYLCVLHDASELMKARASAEQFRLLADAVPAMIAYYEAGSFRCMFANRRYAHAFGWTEQSIVGRRFSEVIGEQGGQEVQPHVDRVMRDHETVTYERRLTRADGSLQWIEVDLLPHLNAQGAPMGAFVLVSDITRQREAEQAVRESEERLARFMQASAEGVVFHQDGVITDVNPPICELTGYRIDELLGRSTFDFVAPEHAAQARAALAAGNDVAYESVVVDRHGQRIPVEFIGRSMVRRGEHLRMTIVRDIRDRHAAQARIHHLAHHDALTALPNRMAFMAQLDARMSAARIDGSTLALLFIDLDNFKRVNDSLGHLVGDSMLQTVAERIKHALRASDMVARFGGDEFMVLLTQAQHREAVEDVARKLLVAIEQPVLAEGRQISVTPSIGIARFPGEASTPAELIKHADSAMYLAKSRGRANFQFFDPSVVSSAYAALVMESEIAQALERHEFVLHFQPQVRIDDGAVVGAEALIRWNHPQRGLIYPNDFIPAVEQQRLMLPLGQWVIAEAVRWAKRWADAGIGPRAPIGVNLSTVQFQSMGFVEAVEQLLSEAGLPGSTLELELSERMLMDDLPEVKQRLAQLKALGLHLSVDDFGTGYFSLRHLKELPIDKVKIDRSFVQDLPHAIDSVAITRAIIQMASSLGQRVIAEGVETAAQRQFLAEQGCDELQGQAVSPPLPAEEFERWLALRRMA